MTVAAPPPNSRQRRPPVVSSHPVHAYANAVDRGDVIAGRLVQLACRRHLRDLRRAVDPAKRKPRDGDLWFDETAANRVLQFFGFLRHRKGQWANQAVVLEPWQQFRIGAVFGWKRWDAESGLWLRRFRTAYNEVARKNGKTTEAAGIGNYLAFFDGEAGAEVYAAATKRDQAKICWGEAKWQMERLPAVMKRGVTVLTANMHSLATASKFEPLGTDEDSTDGLNVHGLVLDELHAWKNRDYLEKLTTAAGSRLQPLIWIITTAGPQGESLYAEQHEYATKVLEGVVDDDTFFAFIACIDDPEKWADEGEWPKANPNLGVSVKVSYLREQSKKAQEIAAQENAFKRYHCNVRTSSSEKWISAELWAAQSPRRPLDDLKGRKCYIGGDLSSTVDLTSLALWFPDEEGRGGDLLIECWVPAENIVKRSHQDQVPYTAWAGEGHINQVPGGVIRYDLLRQAVRDRYAEDYDVRSIAFDKWNATELATDLEDDGFTVVLVPPSMERWNPLVKEFERLFLERELRHGDHPVMRWCASNVVLRMDTQGNRRPDKAKSTERIDCVIAACLAIGEAMADRAKGEEEFGVYAV